MATKELMTRIALKYDSYENWTNSNLGDGKGANLILLKGEIGICEIPGSVKTFEENGKTVTVETAPTVLFKVGDGKNTPFKDLPWASAKAADVYGWAKSETVELVEKNETVEGVSVKKQYLQFKTGDTVNHFIDLSSFATDDELDALARQVKAITDALGLGDDGDGDATIQGQLVEINTRLNNITGIDYEDGSHTDGLIDEAEDRIEAKLGGDFGTGDGQKTVAKTIEDAQKAAEDHADTAIANLSKDDGAIFTLNGRVGALEDRVDLESGETVKGVVTDAIEALDSVNAGDLTDGVATANTIVKGVSQTDGIVTVTYGKLTRDELPDLMEEDIPEIHANKVVVADATTDSEGNTVAKVTLDAKLTAIDGDISSIRDAIAGGVHFVGTIAADADFPTAPNSGDVVIKGTQEYIYNGTTWEPLGDVTRIGAVEGRVDAIEEQIAAMDADFDADANEFVTGIVQVDGKITKIDTARPTADNVKYGTTTAGGTEITVKAKIDELANEIGAVADKLEAKVDLDEGETVTGKIDEALEGLNLAATQATGDGDFVVSVTQENGQIAVEKGKLPEATTEVKGITTLGAKGGAATFDAVDTLSQTVNELSTITIPGITDRVNDIEADYVRIGDDNKMYKGKDGADYIVFNCGSATELI